MRYPRPLTRVKVNPEPKGEEEEEEEEGEEGRKGGQTAGD